MTDATEPRSAKRPRLEHERSSSSGGGIQPEPAAADSLDSELEDATRDKELWLDDGNIVLVCGGIMFKVYRGLLAAQSPVFGDMFTVASSSSGAHLGDVPTVRLTDSPEDLRHLLRALVPSTQRSVFKSQFGDFTIHQLSALIRLAHKYQIEDVQKQAVAALRISYPSDFQAWEKRDSQRVIGATSVSSGIEVMSLARLVDEPKMLPSAFYMCTLAGGLIVDGWRREDGTLQTLDNADLKWVINGYGALRQRANLMLARIFDISHTLGGVQSPGHCHVALTSAYLQEARVCKIMGFKLLHPWKGMIGQWATKYAFCEVCAKVLEERSTVERKALWDALPTMFGLKVEGWAPAPPQPAW
ncbi:hypothetical protein GSI_14913 [Ganoderma sinense ZZ0214-1]|uniref:BTB domain-containing protein n=1 Tax=Ganoderma sinense ZZ0214-1 TaxID=1077348 RepID=A0A2G8RQ10_9APHY|nr:hypothetical protein GSI_14913 [Ganoderma sinense ZZ0214-1]